MAFTKPIFIKLIITQQTFMNISHTLLETNSKKNVKNKDKISFAFE
jgi:hypothetical protein